MVWIQILPFVFMLMDPDSDLGYPLTRGLDPGEVSLFLLKIDT